MHWVATVAVKVPAPSGVVAENLNNITKKFALYQNYPNPFNAKTIIRFDVENDCHVVLKLYDIRGQEGLLLTDRFYSQGIYHLKIETSELASGVYFYKIEMERFADVKKMVVLKT